MSNEMKPIEAQLILLRDINAVKDKLFGRFTRERTKEVKISTWKDICKKAKSLGLLGRTRDYKYMRDVYWQNMKRSTLRRRERRNVTGTRFAPLVNSVLEIVDSASSSPEAETSQQISIRRYAKKSPKPTFSLAPIESIDYNINEGINDMTPSILIERDEAANRIDTSTAMIEDLDEESNEDEQIEEQSTSNGHEEAEAATNNTTIIANDVISAPNAKDTRFKSKNYVGENADDSNDNGVKIQRRKKGRKAQLKLDLLELQKYKAQLEVLRLEIHLGIQPSEFTKAIAKRIKKQDLKYETDVDDTSDFSI